MSYQLPLNLIPIFDWVNSDMNYSATYNWVRGSKLENGTNLGNTISNNRNFSLNGSFNLERLYNHVPFLKKANERANKSSANINRNRLGSRAMTVKNGQINGNVDQKKSTGGKSLSNQRKLPEQSNCRRIKIVLKKK
jgi:cell surface protein SprA